MNRDDARRSLSTTLALAAVLATFLPTLRFGFVNWDDPIHVLENPLVVRPSTVPLRDHLLTPGLGYPIPVPILVYRALHAAFGVGSAAPFHATSVALHVLACWLVARLARSFGLGSAAVTLAVLTFGLHPVVAESVSWISGQKDLLVTVFSLAALVLAARAGTQTPASRAAIFVLSVLALACKPVAAFLALAIPVVRVALRHAPTKAEALHQLPFVLVVLAYVPIAFAGQSRLHAISEPTSFAMQLRTMHYALGFHLDLALLLEEPSSKYMPRVFPPPFTPRVDLMPIVVSIVLVAIGSALDPSRRRAFVAACLVAVAAYAPNSNVIPLTRFLADTYVYLPLVGLAIALGIGFDGFLSRLEARRRLYALAVPTVTALALAMLAIPASARYETSLALWSQALRTNPHDVRICRAWAIEARKAEGPRVGLAAIDRCVARFGPRDLAKTRGNALLRLGRTADALAEYETASRFHPEDAELTELIEAIRASRVRAPASDVESP